MKLETLVEVSEKISLTSRKKEKISLIAGLLRETRAEEIAVAASFLSGQLPQGRLGIGWKMVEKATRSLLPVSHPITLSEVCQYFDAIALEQGSGSSDRKIRAFRELLSRTSEKEKRFLVRLISGEIRQGALQGLVMEGIAQAASLPLSTIRRAHMFSGEIGKVARIALEGGEAGLGRFGPRLFHPIYPMLANTAENEREALERLSEAAWEFKIDGARIQLHKCAKEVRIFTRHLKEITERLPDIVAVARRMPIDEAIIEGEAIALKPDGKPLPFQTTMRRFGRIQDVEQMQKKLPLTPYFFDLIYLDGEPIFQRSYRERFRLLAERISPAFMIDNIVTSDEKKAKEFLLKSLRAGHEGVMAKGLDAPYMAGQRGFHWIKIKPAHTLDLVVLAAEWGHGRRKGWLSNLHLGARDPESGGFVMLSKTFKGLTDEMLRWQTKRLLALEVGRDAYTVYVRPELVVEVAFNELQKSPRYPGGLALRFARVKRFREEKTPLEADSIQTVRTVFEASRS